LKLWFVNQEGVMKPWVHFMSGIPRVFFEVDTGPHIAIGLRGPEKEKPHELGPVGNKGPTFMASLDALGS